MSVLISNWMKASLLGPSDDDDHNCQSSCIRCGALTIVNVGTARALPLQKFQLFQCDGFLVPICFR